MSISQRKDFGLLNDLTLKHALTQSVLEQKGVVKDLEPFHAIGDRARLLDRLREAGFDIVRLPKKPDVLPRGCNDEDMD